MIASGDKAQEMMEHKGKMDITGRMLVIIRSDSSTIKGYQRDYEKSSAYYSVRDGILLLKKDLPAHRCFPAIVSDLLWSSGFSFTLQWL